ncbi:MAG: PEP-CTERM sorting domain-containing protein [Bryobacteraceae bacterium]|nr:PEP-CTERM sorting domain-containing protein [Bryobacteraceae bacterium]
MDREKNRTWAYTFKKEEENQQMKTRYLRVSVLVFLSALSAVQAAPVIFNLAPNQISTFSSVVTATGASLITVPVTMGNAVFNYTDQNGNPATVSVYSLASNTLRPSDVPGYTYGPTTMSGAAWRISPYSSAGDPIPGFGSGIEFRFSSPVNAFAIEIGDWATCCMDNTRPLSVRTTYGVPSEGSGLWISFDGGAWTLPANALSALDNPGYASGLGFVNIIGAIDSSNTFSSVRLFGDGFGEYLVAGGSLRFATVPIGSVGGGVIPEPSTGLLAGAGLLLVGYLLRRRVA